MAPWLANIINDTVDPETFHEIFPWAEEMIGCPHDQVYHKEGDPWTHTKMVVEALRNDPAYLEMSEERREILRIAAWMHDVAKPATTEEYYCEKENRMRVSQPGHAPLGATMAWQGLVDAGYDIRSSREVAALVFWHQRPSFLLNHSKSLKMGIMYSHDADRGNWHELLTLCRNDQRGRISVNTADTLEALDLAEIAIEEMGENIGCNLLLEPWPFETDEARMRFLRGGSDASPFFMPETPSRGRMILMSGLPGAGKDTFIQQKMPDIPVVSLDDIRGQMNVGWNDKQGQVIQKGLEDARKHLRAGDLFIWNATGLSRQLRQKIIGLARDYDAIVEAVSIDIPVQEVMCRNRNRGDRAVPDKVMEKLLRKREIIVSNEVHALWSVDPDMNPTLMFGKSDLFPEPEQELSPDNCG
jgi:predicted kinase